MTQVARGDVLVESPGPSWWAPVYIVAIGPLLLLVVGLFAPTGRSDVGSIAHPESRPPMVLMVESLVFLAAGLILAYYTYLAVTTLAPKGRILIAVWGGVLLLIVALLAIWALVSPSLIEGALRTVGLLGLLIGSAVVISVATVVRGRAVGDLVPASR